MLACLNWHFAQVQAHRSVDIAFPVYYGHVLNILHYQNNLHNKLILGYFLDLVLKDTSTLSH